MTEPDYNPLIIVTVGTPLREVERIVIVNTLASKDGNRTHAAKQLGIGIRTLQRKLKSYEAADAGEV